MAVYKIVMTSVPRVAPAALLLLLIGAVGSAAAADRPPLIEAVRLQDYDTVERLLRSGADVDIRQPDGATALHWAVYRDDVSLVRLLLDGGANPQVVNRLGSTPVWLAAVNGNAVILQTLVDRGADVNAALPEGETPLMAASRAGHAKAVRVLLGADASVNVRETTRHQTALMWAAADGDDEVVRLLLDAGADVAARSRVRPTWVYTESNGGVFDQGMLEQLGGFTSLLFAARHGHLASARLLLAAGADIDQPAANGASPLVVAIHSGHMAFAHELLAGGADPNTSGAGYTALHAAILRGNLSLVEALLANGADPDARVERPTPVRRASTDWALRPVTVSATPFWLAAFFREPAIMRALVAGGANPHLTSLEQWSTVAERAGGVGPPRIIGGFVSPLMAAVRGGSDRSRFFLVPDADPVAEEQRAVDSVRLAVELGVDVGATDENGSTALHDAARRNLPDVVYALVTLGADLDAKNGAGRTPLELAEASSRRPSIVDLGGVERTNSAADVLRELEAATAASPPGAR